MIDEELLLDRDYKEITDEEGSIYVKSKHEDSEDSLVRVVAALYTPRDCRLVINEMFLEVDGKVDTNTLLSAEVAETERLDKLVEMFLR